MENINNIAKEINEVFVANHMNADAYVLNKNTLEVRIEGDWKHDHLYGKNLINRNFDCEIECVEIEYTDSDYYAATYQVKINKVYKTNKDV